MGAIYSPPRDATGAAIAGMGEWSQTINVTWRNPDRLVTVEPPGSTDHICVEVLVRKNGDYVLGAGWLLTRKEGE